MLEIICHSNGDLNIKLLVDVGTEHLNIDRLKGCYSDPHCTCQFAFGQWEEVSYGNEVNLMRPREPRLETTMPASSRYRQQSKLIPIIQSKNNSNPKYSVLQKGWQHWRDTGLDGISGPIQVCSRSWFKRTSSCRSDACIPHWCAQPRRSWGPSNLKINEKLF